MGMLEHKTTLQLFLKKGITLPRKNEHHSLTLPRTFKPNGALYTGLLS